MSGYKGFKVLINQANTFEEFLQKFKGDVDVLGNTTFGSDVSIHNNKNFTVYTDNGITIDLQWNASLNRLIGSTNNDFTFQTKGNQDTEGYNWLDHNGSEIMRLNRTGNLDVNGIITGSIFRIANTFASLEFNETDQTGANGLYRFEGSNNEFKLAKNTSLTRDFSTRDFILSFDSNNVATFGGNLRTKAIQGDFANISFNSIVRDSSSTALHIHQVGTGAIADFRYNTTFVGGGDLAFSVRKNELNSTVPFNSTQGAIFGGDVSMSKEGGTTLNLHNTNATVPIDEILGKIEFESSDASSFANGVRATISAVQESNLGQTGLSFSTTISGDPTLNEAYRIDGLGYNTWTKGGTFGAGIQAPSYKISGSTILSGSAAVILGSGGSTGEINLLTSSGIALAINGINATFGGDVTAPNFIGNWNGYTSDNFIKKVNAQVSTDLNNFSENGMYRVNSSAINAPQPGYFGVVSYGGSNVSGQLATDFATGESYVRGYSTSGWTTWRALLDDGNFIAGTHYQTPLADVAYTTVDNNFGVSQTLMGLTSNDQSYFTDELHVTDLILSNTSSTSYNKTTAELDAGSNLQLANLRYVTDKVSGTVQTNVANNYTKQQYSNYVAIGTGAGATAWNLDDAQKAKITLTGYVTFNTPTNIKDGGTYVLKMYSTTAVTRTISWGTGFVEGDVLLPTSYTFDAGEMIYATFEGSVIGADTQLNFMGLRTGFINIIA